MLTENAVNETGNARYEGYCVEIIHELSKRLGFNYTFVVSEDDYGTKDPITEEWRGAIREIIDGVSYSSIYFVSRKTLSSLSRNKTLLSLRQSDTCSLENRVKCFVGVGQHPHNYSRIIVRF